MWQQIRSLVVLATASVIVATHTPPLWGQVSIDLETMKLKRLMTKSSGIGGEIGNAIGDDNEHAYYFMESTGDWFVGANWAHGATGQRGVVPGPGDEAVIGEDSVAQVNGVASGGPVEVRMILQFDQSRLEVLPGTLIHYDAYLAVEESTVALVGAAMEITAPGGVPGGSGWGCRNCGFSNPSAVVTTLLDLAGASMDFGLGGTLPASPSATGLGHYATFVADRVELDGAELGVSLFYGFEPAVGDSFQIISAGTELNGRFANADEGNIVSVFGDVGLQISYAGGDGNDVVLKGVQVPELATSSLLLCALALMAGNRRRVSVSGKW
jgi:hypothetical protein